jgi:hypothetical protein
MTEAVELKTAILPHPSRVVIAPEGPVHEKELTPIEIKGKVLSQKVNALFGSGEKSPIIDTTFKPAIEITEATTLDNLKPAIKETLVAGMDFWAEFKKTNQFSLEADQNITMYERALEYIDGPRNTSTSLISTIEQLSAGATKQAAEQSDKRLDYLYSIQVRKAPLFLGRFVFGKLGVLWNVGGKQIDDYEKSFRQNTEKVKDFIVGKVSQDNPQNGEAKI